VDIRVPLWYNSRMTEKILCPNCSFEIEISAALSARFKGELQKNG
jgi:hypothetical protein